MNPESWQEVLRLFADARALPPQERAAFLARECRDSSVRAEVEKLLAAQAPEDFLEPPPLDEPTPGHDLGDFTLLEEVGRGGMGVVYRAVQRPLQRIVAVKVLPGSFALTPRQVDRFQREARAAARLTHPNLVAVLTVGEERGVHFFAMEYVDGRNLAQELERLRADLGATKDERAHLPSSRAADYFRSVAETIRQAADGLAYAHEHGVVHRDVKPSNLLLDPSGRVKLVDFGLARDEEQGSLSTTGDIAGTPHYMSPEQARAQRSVIDHRTDVYSLGVVLYELLTLRRPFEGKTTQEVLANLLQRDPVRIRKLNPRVPRDLETICNKAMARAIRDRYLDAGAFRDDLARFLSHEAIRARPPGLHARLRNRVRRHAVPLALLGVAAMASVFGRAVTQAAQRRSQHAEQLEAIRSALAEAPLDRLPPSRQLDLWRRMQTLRADSSVLAADPDGTVVRLERDFLALRNQLLERGKADLAFARDAHQPESAREDRRLSGLMTLTRAAQLFADDDELQHLASIESALPTLAVTAFDEHGEPTAAKVYLREVDVFTSAVAERISIGSTPLPPTPVLPGYYRVVVAFELGGLRELIANPGPSSMAMVVRADRRADEGSEIDGMIRIPALDYTFPAFEGESFLQGRTVHLDAFYVDRAECSNAEYFRFLQATGTPPPRYWKYITDMRAFLDRYGDYPVVGMTWSDANACAQWSGKRLLTAAEWHRVAGGPENWPTPYSADADAPPRGNVLGPDPSMPLESDYWSLYLAQANPVLSNQDARSPDGLYNMYGNVAELTESMAVVLASPTEYVPRPHDRLFCGQAWFAHTNAMPMRSLSYWGVGPHYTSEHIGFRCARSVD